MIHLFFFPTCAVTQWGGGASSPTVNPHRKHCVFSPLSMVLNTTVPISLSHRCYGDTTTQSCDIRVVSYEVNVWVYLSAVRSSLIGRFLEHKAHFLTYCQTVCRLSAVTVSSWFTFKYTFKLSETSERQNLQEGHKHNTATHSVRYLHLSLNRYQLHKRVFFLFYLF